eukprot:ctg_1513.g543
MAWGLRRHAGEWHVARQPGGSEGIVRETKGRQRSCVELEVLHAERARAVRSVVRVLALQAAGHGAGGQRLRGAHRAEARSVGTQRRLGAAIAAGRDAYDCRRGGGRHARVDAGVGGGRRCDPRLQQAQDKQRKEDDAVIHGVSEKQTGSHEATL